LLTLDARRTPAQCQCCRTYQATLKIDQALYPTPNPPLDSTPNATQGERYPRLSVSGVCVCGAKRVWHPRAVFSTVACQHTSPWQWQRGEVCWLCGITRCRAREAPQRKQIPSPPHIKHRAAPCVCVHLGCVGQSALHPPVTASRARTCVHLERGGWQRSDTMLLALCPLRWDPLC
jgi:hypothetical protein